MANEKRLIDAKALEKQIKQAFEDTNPYAMGIMLRWIRKQTKVDAVEVVLCEKCLYRSQYCDENGLYNCGGLQTEDGNLVLMVKPDFFCAFGERRGAKMDGERKDNEKETT